MRFASSWLVVLVVGAAACKGSPFRPDAGPLKDAFEPAWFSPKPGEAKNWDIQLAAPFDLAAQRTMMILSLWDVVPSAQTITYADASTVTVPAGALPTAIADLHAMGTKVICHVNTGAIRLDDPDAMKFPGYEASPPNRPDPIAANSVIGWSTTEADANERFIDIRVGTGRDTVAPLINKRLDLAKAIGCDGVLADRNNAAEYEGAANIGHGFGTIDIVEHTSWNVELTQQAHAEARLLSIGMRNGYTLTGQADALSDDYDWLLADRCAEYDICDQARPFINKSRAVFAIDYTTDELGDPQSSAGACADWPQAMIEDGIIKDAALTGSTRETCP